MVKAGAGRPTKGYFLPDGTRVPGTTTIISRFKDSGALMYWAWSQGMQGKDYRQTSGDAAAAGTFAHAMIEADILGNEFTWPTPFELGVDDETYAILQGRATRAFKAYQEWKAGARVEVLHTELPLTSRELLYGGTIDAVAVINGSLRILDWKSTGRVYADHVVQIAAYRTLWNENHPDEVIRDTNLLRIDKEYAGFDYGFWPGEVVDLGEEAFALARQLYDIDKKIKKAIGR